jgi:hypothetical protein
MKVSSRKWIGIFSIILLLFSGAYLLIFEWFVPRTAILGAPVKWNHIPLQQDTATAIAYFGKADRKGKDFLSWRSGAPDRFYFLTIFYNRDRAAEGYSIRYTYRNKLFSRTYVVDSILLR